MNIRIESWHYKYVAKRWTEYPESLCWYFWKIVLSMIGMTAVGAGAVIVAIGALFFLAFPILQWFIEYDVDIQGAAFLLWVVIGAVMFIKYRIYLYDTKQLKRKTKEYRDPGLVSQFLHAQHRKICPLLTYESRRR